MRNRVLISFAVFIAGLCSIIYELLISTTATYFLGDGVRQFSIIIGVYLFSMGIGAFLSKFLREMPLKFFVHIEFLLGLIGGISVPLLFYSFVSVNALALQIICLVIILLIGLLTGMEVPLLTFVSNEVDFKNNLSNVLSLDYIGGLIATLLFPFILLPFVGLYYSSLIFGIINILLGLVLNHFLLEKSKKTLVLGIASMTVLVILVVFGGKFLKIWDQAIYKNPIVLNEQTPYQKIVVTKKKEDVRLYLNRVIQFSSSDEYRYHEPLVHIPISLHKNPKSVLILGGGENLASREVLKHPGITRVDVVDIDSTMFHLAKRDPYFTKINEGAAKDIRVNLIAQDAFTFLYNEAKGYDIIIADLPDPTNEALARLYSKQFFLLAKQCLNKDGLFVTQSGEIYFSNSVFSCINNTLAPIFNYVKPYHSYIPSFGDWGFVMASDEEIEEENIKSVLPSDLKFLTENQFQMAFQFPKDITIKETKVNTLDSPIILNYFIDDWNKWKTDLQSGTK
ncbi:polyamine aminopropyltransferase [Maribacter sp. M208]|uniref:polyamine aminopropyltransferase n=1 Tax=Maribacter huludaoensis TaxID=3030010 RepID=UPI0023EB82F5|nr:polyamine aminopropyltransferase [Maribacter huludaoensis]MDF4222478.1 polyamine aminopropyltransferase [Maribacter huludaoensis]